MTNALTLQTTVDIDLKRLWWVLIAGFEGGIGYWARIEEYVHPTENNPLTFCGSSDGRVYKYADYPLNKDTAVILSDATERRDQDCDTCMDVVGLMAKDHTCGVSIWTLDFDAIKRGLRVCAKWEPERFAQIMEENDDAETADVFIQLCLFGEIVYG